MSIAQKGKKQKEETDSNSSFSFDDADDSDDFVFFNETPSSLTHHSAHSHLNSAQSPSNFISTSPSSSGLDVQESSSAHDVDLPRLIAEGLIELKIKHSLTKALMDNVLKFVNSISVLVFDSKLLPDSYYYIEKTLAIKDDPLKHSIGFICQNCNKQILILRKDAVQCPLCKTKLKFRRILNNEYFFQNDIEIQLRLLLESKKLIERTSQEESDLISTIFDGSVYKEYQNLKRNKSIIILTAFSDGVSISKSSKFNVWPIFIKLNDLSCSQEQKTFLYANYYGESKPDINFFLRDLISSLNRMFNEGIYINKLQTTVYPMLIVSIFDTPARSHFLNHVSHNGYFGCTICTIEGERKDTHFQLFKPGQPAELRCERDSGERNRT